MKTESFVPGPRKNRFEHSHSLCIYVYVLGDQIGTIPEVSLECFVRGQRSNLRFEHLFVALNYCFSTINKEKKINKLSEFEIF